MDVERALMEGPEYVQKLKDRANASLPGRKSGSQRASLEQGPNQNGQARASGGTTPTLYEVLGKEKADEAIASMVEIMFQKILADASMAPFFQEADVTHIKRHLMAFCITAFGGPSKYSGLDLNRAHKRVRERKEIEERHFDIMLAHMRRALREVVPGGQPDAMIETAISQIAQHKAAVLAPSVDSV